MNIPHSFCLTAGVPRAQMAGNRKELKSSMSLWIKKNSRFLRFQPHHRWESTGRTLAAPSVAQLEDEGWQFS